MIKWKGSRSTDPMSHRQALELASLVSCRLDVTLAETEESAFQVLNTSICKVRLPLILKGHSDPQSCPKSPFKSGALKMWL